MSVHFIASVDNISSLTLEEVGIIKYHSSADVFKLLDTWTTNSIASELITFEKEIKEFVFYRNTTIELYAESLKVDSKVINIDKTIRLIKACNDIIAAICGSNLNIYSISDGLIAVLCGHLDRVRDYCFLKEKLFSVSEDRMLKIWDLKNYCCEYTTSILSKAALSSVDVDHDGLRVVVADEDGTLFFFELMDGKRLQELKKIGIRKILKPKIQETGLVDVNEDNVKIDVDWIVSLKFLYNSTEKCLFLGCSNGIVIMEVNNYSVIYMLDFALENISKSVSNSLNDDNDDKVWLKCTDTYSLTALAGVKNGFMISLYNKMARQGTIIGLRLPYLEFEDSSNIKVDQNSSLDSIVSHSINSHVKGKWGDHIYSQCLSLLSRLDIRELKDLESLGECPSGIPSYVQKDLHEAFRQIKSPLVQIRSLRCSMADNDILLTKYLSTDSLKKRTPKKNAMNQPVTFKKSVKSSGYSVGPKCAKLFTTPVDGKSNMKLGTDFSSKSEVQGYPSNCGIPIYERKSRRTRCHSSGILGLAYHSSGKLLASASADQSARFYKLNSSHSKSFIEHNGAVSSVSWSNAGHSYFGPLILTGSVDRHARLWSIEKSESLLDFHYILNSSKAREPATSKSICFDSDVKGASFFYQDKFISISSGKTIYLYSYELVRPDFKSIKPGFNPNRYKLLSSFSEPQAHSITSFTCANNYKSHILIQSASDKSLNLWDVSTNQVFSSFSEAHSRWIHSISVADYKFVPSTFENLFLTAAVTDGIKVWDIRHRNPVMHLTGHVNRSSPIQCAFSPCGRYIGTGSEDRHVYFYDIRKGQIAAKSDLVQSGAVLSLAFSPIKAELATGTSEGILSFLSDAHI